jgi:hypothetical protein
MDRTGLRSCPMAGFYISVVESLDSAVTMLVKSAYLGLLNVGHHLSV